MGTGDKDTTNTEDSGDNNDTHGHFPKNDEFFDPIDQLAKEEQEGDLNGEDGNPAQDL